MTLPTSRDLTAAPGGIIPSSLLNDIQDSIISLNTQRIADEATITALLAGRTNVRTMIIDLAALGEEPGATGWNSDGDSLTCAATTAGFVAVSIPIALGDRLLAVRLIGKAASGAAGDLRLTLRKLTATVGSASGTAADLVAQVQSTATTNIQSVLCTVASPVALAASISLKAHVVAFNSAGIKTAFRLEVDFDFP
jgi:hypothetical protein